MALRSRSKGRFFFKHTDRISAERQEISLPYFIIHYWVFKNLFGFFDNGTYEPSEIRVISCSRDLLP